jgi:outer membrane protein
MIKTTKLTLFFFPTFVFCLHVAAQDKWDLRRCVQYALDNNISIKQADIDSRVAKLTYDQSKWNQLGNYSFNTALGFNFGRSIDRTTNIYVNTQSIFQGYNLNAGVTLFNWFALRRAVESNKYSYEAQVVNIDKIKNDVTLNVAAAYLQALLSREQVSLAQTKLELTRQQLDNTRKLVDAGSVPELNAAELEVQFATDTASLISARETYDINNLQLKAILNLDAAAPFDLDTPPVESIPVEPIATLQPDEVYAVAVGTFPQQKMNDLRISAAQKNVEYSRGLLYPTLTAFVGLGDNFANNLKRMNENLSVAPTGAYALDNVSGTQYPVYAPFVTTTYSKQSFGQYFTGYGSQLSNNFGQQVGLQLNVPIFNGNLSRTNYKKAQLNVTTARLTKENDLLSLKQSIYQAYYNAVASLQKYEANQKAVVVAEKSFDLSTKRYNIGMLNTIDYLTNQNNLFTARINALIAHYDYVFRMKVLEYYKGLGIKL